MTTLSGLFRKLTFVDEEYIQTKSTADARKRYTYYGVTIFITGLFAMLSGGLALSYIFPEEPTLIIPIALFWGGVIIIIDRGIIGAKSYGALWIRGFFAIIIAFSVSIPLELKIMEGKIDSILVNKSNQFKKNQTLKLNSLDSLNQIERQVIFDKYSEHQEAYLENKRKAEMELRSWDPDKQKAIAAGPGDRHKAYMDKSEVENSQQKLYKDELDHFDRKYFEKKGRIQDEHAPEFANDLLDRIIAIEEFKNIKDSKGRITKKSKAARNMSWVLKAIFFMIELLPLVIKLSFPKDDYVNNYFGVVKDFEDKFELAKVKEFERVTEELAKGVPIEEIHSTSKLYAFLENNHPDKSFKQE